MNLISIVPVKDLECTKSRLSSILNPGKRQDLTLTMLSRALKVLNASQRIQQILVVTPDSRVLSFVQEHGIMGLREEGTGLNSALEQANRWCSDRGCDAVLIIPADIPFFRNNDIESIIQMGAGEEKVLVIAPDKDKKGTNALFVQPPGILNYAFGKNSFTVHRKQALARHVKLKVYTSASICFDVDYPKHYRLLTTKKAFSLKESEFL